MPACHDQAGQVNSGGLHSPLCSIYPPPPPANINQHEPPSSHCTGDDTDYGGGDGSDEN